MSGADRCQHCDCPNQHCACVLRERVRSAERRENEAMSEAYRYRRLWEAAASCLAYNRDRLRKPRGEDERLLVENALSDMHGPFWSGKTRGWLQPTFFDCAKPESGEGA
jgi:hypothetical protein